MDILKPELIWIEGRCYRQRHLNRSSATKISTSGDERVSNNTGENEMSCKGGEYDPEEYRSEYSISATTDGNYKGALNIPRMFFGVIIGPKGSTRMRLEEETKTHIRVPSMTLNGDVVVTGKEEAEIISAFRRIELIIASVRHKQPFTHFLSVPIGSKRIEVKFLQFKEEVCKRFTNHRIDASLFQSPEKLHLTLGTLVLGNANEESKVVEMLDDFKDTYIKPLLRDGPLRLRVLGVEYMNDDPREVDVLYGKVQLTDGSSRFQQLADDLVRYIQKKGFMPNKYEQVKLHVTLMNTLFRDDCATVGIGNSTGQTRTQRETFDASGILKVYENYHFGDLTVDAIDLSIRHTTDANGYFQMVSCLNLK